MAALCEPTGSHDVLVMFAPNRVKSKSGMRMIQDITIPGLL